MCKAVNEFYESLFEQAAKKRKAAYLKYWRNTSPTYREQKRRQRRAYRWSVGGYLSNKYNHMRRRILGIGSMQKKQHLYGGLTILSKQEFLLWAEETEVFKTMFMQYLESGKDLRLAPTVDRINPCFGYERWNMQWLTHSENSRKAVIQHHYGISAG